MVRNSEIHWNSWKTLEKPNQVTCYRYVTETGSERSRRIFRAVQPHPIDTMETHPDLWYAKTGWIYKQSKWIKQWRRRYCKLYGSDLLISKKEDKSPHITINLLQLSSVQTSKAFRENAFKLIMNDGTIFYFVADYPDEQQDWMDVLQNVSKFPPLKIEKFTENRLFVVSDDQKFYTFENGRATRQEVIIPVMTARQKQKLVLSERRNKPFMVSVTDGKTPVVMLDLDKKIESIQPSGLAAFIKKK